MSSGSWSFIYNRARNRRLKTIASTVYGKEEVDVSLRELHLDQEFPLTSATPWNVAGFRKSSLEFRENPELHVE